MKRFVLLFLTVSLGYFGSQAQTVIRKQFGTMDANKIAAIPDFVLPAIYSDRNAHPLPAVVNHETDANYKKYMPPTGWCIDGWSCANASAVSYSYDYAVQSGLNLTTSGSNPMYTYNYTYHFLNSANQSTGGDGWMYVEAFDILKETGCPTSTDFGGFDGSVDQTNAWMTGYDKYYTAMKIRIDQYYKIDMATTAADELVRQIVYDYGDQSPAGALLSFQANSDAMPTTTTNGRKTFTSLGGSGGHALTICGYDMNHAGGSWLIQSGWGDGDYWCPFGLLRKGGAWYAQGGGCESNKYVMFCRIKKNYTPKLTFKVTLTHAQRNQVCIMTGVANSATASAPTKTKDYQGAFNYAGGSVPMCGSGKSSTIEIGLDLTDFQADVAGGQGTFFLKVITKSGSGTVNSLSLMDYTSGTVKEIACKQSNVSLPSNSTTILSVPWNGTITEVANSRSNILHQGNGLTAAYNANVKKFDFGFSGGTMKSALLQIKDLSGRTVFSRACESDKSVSWDLKNYFGLKVGNGAYIASVNIEKKDGSSHTVATKILVKD